MRQTDWSPADHPHAVAHAYDVTLRVVFASKVEVRLGHETRTLPERLHGALPVPHAEHPTLIIEEARHQLTWATPEAMAEPLAYLISQRDYARTLRWAAERTRRVNAPVVEPSARARRSPMASGGAYETKSQLALGCFLSGRRLGTMVGTVVC